VSDGTGRRPDGTPCQIGRLGGSNRLGRYSGRNKGHLCFVIYKTEYLNGFNVLRDFLLTENIERFSFTRK
jgi:hypothetical protein